MSANGSPAPRPSTSRLIRSQLPSTCRGGLGSCVAEDVRVTADQLLGFPSATRRRAGAALLEQQRQEDDLEEHVAELVAELGVVAARRRVGELVGLLDRVRDDRSARPARGPRGTPAAAGG